MDKKPIFQIPQIGQQAQQTKINRMIYPDLDYIVIRFKSMEDFVYYTHANQDAEILELEGCLVNALSLAVENEAIYILKKGKTEVNPSIEQDLILCNFDPHNVPIVQLVWCKSPKYEEAERITGVILYINM